MDTDALIQATIWDKFGHCTVLTIAHRLDTIIDSDRVLVLQHGKLVEFDHPHRLLDNNPEGHFGSMVDATGPAQASALRSNAEAAYATSLERKSSQ